MRCRFTQEHNDGYGRKTQEQCPETATFSIQMKKHGETWHRETVRCSTHTEAFQAWAAGCADLIDTSNARPLLPPDEMAACRAAEAQGEA